MATKKNMTKEKLQKNNDAAVYKVMIALVAACVCLLGMRSLRDYYATIEGFSALYDYTNTIALVGLILAAAAAAVTIFWKNNIARAIAPWFLVAGLLVAATGRSMHVSGVADFTFLYFLCFAVLIQYIIFQLYRWEFFLFSLSTVTAGGVFFSFSKGLYWTAKNVTVLVILVLVLAATTFCCRTACANKGFFSLGKFRIRLYGAKAAPALLYIANALWIVCAACIPLLGGLFAYYCMFAAIAVEFIAAVYYTFQLN